MSDCDCHDWKENAPKINNALAGMYVHGARGEAVQLTPARFCPWCGSKLPEALGPLDAG